MVEAGINITAAEQGVLFDYDVARGYGLGSILPRSQSFSKSSFLSVSMDKSSLDWGHGKLQLVLGIVKSYRR